MNLTIITSGGSHIVADTPKELEIALMGYFCALSDFGVWHDGVQYIGVNPKPIIDHMQSLSKELEKQKALYEQNQQESNSPPSDHSIGCGECD